MKYHYEKTEYGKPVYGRMIEMHDDIHLFGTLFEKDGKGVILVQKRFVCKCLYWDRIDYWLANDIYEHPKFAAWFEEHATENGKKPKEEKSESAFVHHVVKNRIGF